MRATGRDERRGSNRDGVYAVLAELLNQRDDFRSTDPDGLLVTLVSRYCYERAGHANVSPANRMFYGLVNVHTSWKRGPKPSSQVYLPPDLKRFYELFKRKKRRTSIFDKR